MASQHSYHDASLPLFDVREWKEETTDGFVYQREGPQHAADVSAEHAWPTHCQCGYEFAPEDNHQVFSESLYARSDTGDLVTIRNAGPGAIYDAEWLRGREQYSGPDGKCLIAICPDGCEWMIDGPASNGPGWTRTGTVPNLTVHPSIQTGKYHGWLKDGWFVDA
jgi:hypothetical protein